MAQLPRAARVYVAAVIAVGLAIFAICLPHARVDQPRGVEEGARPARVRRQRAIPRRDLEARIELAHLDQPDDIAGRRERDDICEGDAGPAIARGPIDQPLHGGGAERSFAIESRRIGQRQEIEQRRVVAGRRLAKRDDAAGQHRQFDSPVEHGQRRVVVGHRVQS